jgi:hypothetical protein
MSITPLFILQQTRWPKPNYAEKLYKALLQRIGETKDPRHLGAGKYAEVFWLRRNPRRVLKVTRDQMDAWAMEAVRKKPQRGIVKVHDVFTIAPRQLWGIVAEKLTPMDYEDKILWEDFERAMDHEKLIHLVDELAMFGLIETWVKELRHTYEHMWDDYDEDEENDEDWDDVFYEIDDEVLDALEIWAKALDALHIKWHDVHTGNIMIKRNDYTLVDLGHGQAPRVSLPELEVED